MIELSRVRNFSIIAHPSSTAKLTTGQVLITKETLWS